MSGRVHALVRKWREVIALIAGGAHGCAGPLPPVGNSPSEIPRYPSAESCAVAIVAAPRDSVRVNVRVALAVAERGPDVRSQQLAVLNDVLSAVNFPEVLDSEMAIGPETDSIERSQRRNPRLHPADGRLWFRVGPDGALDSLAVIQGTPFPEIEGRIISAIRNAGSTRRLGVPPPGEPWLIYLIGVYADSGHERLPLFDSLYVRGPRAVDPVALRGNPKPRYPDALHAQGITGGVLTQFIIDRNGRMRDGSLRVLESSHVLFTQTVASTLQAFRFRPATANGCPVPMLVQMPFYFELSR